MFRRKTVILVTCHEPTRNESVTAFVASSWKKVEQFVSSLDNREYSDDPEYFWWAQENFVDNADCVYSMGRVRTYEQDGTFRFESKD